MKNRKYLLSFLGFYPLLLLIPTAFFLVVGSVVMYLTQASKLDYKADNIEHSDSWQSAPFSFLLVIENWVATHTINPFLARLFVFKTAKSSVILMIGWEVVENFGYLNFVSMYNNFSTAGSVASWFGESPGDSLFGDILMGSVGISIAHAISRAHPSYSSSFTDRMSSGTRIGFYLALALALAVSNVLSIFVFILKTEREVPKWINGGLVRDFLSVNYFPIGHLYFVLVQFILFNMMIMVDKTALLSRMEESKAGVRPGNWDECLKDTVSVYCWAMVYMCLVWCATYFLLIRTFVGVLFLSVLFYASFEIWASLKVPKRDKL